jgi:hypothetical protein
MQQDVFTCESRGYVSNQAYMQSVGSTIPLNVALVKAPWEAYWCLRSFDEPTAICATLPGQKIPMCTSHCPRGLLPTTLAGSTSMYCCLHEQGGDLGCTLGQDSRQCVLGQHDVDLFLQFPNIFPDQLCPPNIMNGYSVFPLSKTPAITPGLDDPYAQAKQLCDSMPYLCYGFSIIQDNNDASSVLFIPRPVQLSSDDLFKNDPHRFHNLDTTKSYHFHPSPDATVKTGASLLVAPNIQSTIKSVTTYILERNYGFQCSDDRLNVLEYLESDPGVLFRVQENMHNKWIRDNMPLSTLYSLVQYDFNIGGDNYIYINNLADNSANDIFFNLDIEQQIAYFKNLPFPFDGEVNSNSSNAILFDIQNVIPSTSTNFQVLGTVARNSPAMSLVPQTFLPEEVVVPNSCGPLTVPGPNIDQRYSPLKIRKSDQMVRYWRPVFGTSDGTYNGVVNVYDVANPPFIEVSNTGIHQDPLNYATLLGYSVILQDDIAVIHHDNLATMFFDFIWMDWIAYGSKIPSGYNRLSPNRKCKLNTPLWFDYEIDLSTVPPQNIDVSGFPNYNAIIQTLTTAGTLDTVNLPYPICSVAKCALPVAASSWQTRSIVQQLDPNSRLPFSTSLPNPPEAALLRDPNNIPCDRDHGVCLSSPTDGPGQGTCQCYSSYVVATPISPYLRTLSPEVPRSLKMPSCTPDTRQTCSNPTNLLGQICSGKGDCVVDFTNQGQTSICACGSFPAGCNNGAPADPNSCAKTGLPYLTNGFISIPPQYTQCNVPITGCRFDYVPSTGYSRVSDQYQPSDSYGPELPRMNLHVLTPTGTCVTTTTVTTNVDGTSSVVTTGTPKCITGRYGTYCEYVSLQGGCFDNKDPIFQSLSQNLGPSTEAMCVFNNYLMQYEPIANTAVPPSIVDTLPQVSCQGVMCSGIGQCVHGQINAPIQDLYVAGSAEEQAAILANPYSFYSARRITFIQQAQARLKAQTCVCPIGFTGAYCQFKDCISGCGLGYCVRSIDGTKAPYCVCPQTSTGTVLVSGSQCDQIICGGHGQLLLIQSGVINSNTILPQPVYTSVAPIYSCNCTAPYYQGANIKQLCQSICINGTIKAISATSGITSTNSQTSIDNAVSQSSSTNQNILSSFHSGPTLPTKTTTTTTTTPPPPPPLQSVSTASTINSPVTCVPFPTNVITTPSTSSSQSSSSSSSTGHKSSSSSSSGPNRQSSSSSSTSLSSSNSYSNISSSSSSVNDNTNNNNNNGIPQQGLDWGSDNNPTATSSVAIVTSALIVSIITIGVFIALSKGLGFFHSVKPAKGK